MTECRNDWRQLESIVLNLMAPAPVQDPEPANALQQSPGSVSLGTFGATDPSPKPAETLMSPIDLKPTAITAAQQPAEAD